MLSRNLPRSLRARAAIATAVVAAAALALVAGMLAARPARVLGVDGPSLGYSVARGTGGVSVLAGDTCREHARYWTCNVSSDGSSGLEYRVRSDSRGCWTARLTFNGGLDGKDAPRRASGCIDVRDYLRPFERAFG